MIINFLFDRFLTPELPTNNIIPTLTAHINYTQTPNGGNMIHWNETQRILDRRNTLVQTNHEIRYVKTEDVVHNYNPDEKYIYLVEMISQEYHTMWPLYHISKRVATLINEDKCTLAITHFMGWPMLLEGLPSLCNNIYSAVVFSGITKLDNIKLIFDTAGSSTDEVQNSIIHAFDNRDINELSYMSDDMKKLTRIGYPRVIESNTWEWIFIDRLVSNKTDYLTKYLEKTDKSHSYLYMNSNQRSHRYMMYKATEFLNIKQDSIHSFRLFDTLGNYKNEYYFRTLFEETGISLTDEIQQFKEYLISNPDADQIDLPNDDDFKEIVNKDFISAILKVDEKNISDTYFSLVTETGFLSEKTFKLIYFGHPFILVGETGILKDLKELGYRTFDCVFDESYDDMPIGPEKILFIANQVKQYCGEEGRKRFAEKMPQIEEILRYNRELFLTKDHNEFWANL